MPDRLADTVEEFLATGAVRYSEKETVPAQWRARWRLTKLGEDELLERLASGANYRSAEAVGAFFLDLGHDYTDLLVRARERMPVCHMTLHMIKAYGRIHKNPALADWCDAHLAAAHAFTANGPLYQEAYVNRVKAIKKHSLSA
jgi:hypothetical protein